MEVDLDKIKKLPPDVRKEFMRTFVKYADKKKEYKIKNDFMSFVKHVWPEFVEGSHHKRIADKFNRIANGELKRVINSLLQNIDDFLETGILIAATNHEQLLDSAIWRRFEKVINVNKPDLIISTVSHLNVYVSILKYFFPKKTKVIVRESNFISQNIYLQARSTLFKILYRIFYNNVDCSLVFSKKHKIDILKNTNIKEHKIKIIGQPTGCLGALNRTVQIHIIWHIVRRQRQS